jgi:hypothetical protein
LEKKREKTNEADDVNEFFEDNEELKLKDLDSYMIIKIIIHALSNMIVDELGNEPHFTTTQNFMFMEIADKKFTIEIKDTGMYN